MYKLYAFWSAPKPEDADAFEEHYTQIHGPLAAKVPHIKTLVTTRTPDGLEGGEPAYFRVAEMIFESKADFDQSTESAQWQSLREDAGKLIEEFGVSMTVAIGDDVVTPGQRS